jgi:hypothetical protein
MALNKLFLDGTVHTEPRPSTHFPACLQITLQHRSSEIDEKDGELFDVLLWRCLAHLLQPRVGDRVLVVGLLSSCKPTGDPAGADHSPVLIHAVDLMKIEASTSGIAVELDPPEEPPEAPYDESVEEIPF